MIKMQLIKTSTNLPSEVSGPTMQSCHHQPYCRMASWVLTYLALCSTQHTSCAAAHSTVLHTWGMLLYTHTHTREHVTYLPEVITLVCLLLNDVLATPWATARKMFMRVYFTAVYACIYNWLTFPCRGRW